MRIKIGKKNFWNQNAEQGKFRAKVFNYQIKFQSISVATLFEGRKAMT